MRYYPAFLDLSGKCCLVCGVGTVGLRKLTTILECSPASVLALDVRPASDQAKKLAETHPELIFEHRSFDERDLDGVFLVIASTADAGLNAGIAAACAERGILCNVADDPDAGSFIVPAHVHSGDLTISVSTQGASPALTRRIRQDLQAHFGSRYTGLVEFMRRVRPLVLGLNRLSDENRDLFRALVDSELGDALSRKDTAMAEQIVKNILPESLHPHTGELLHGIC